MNLNLSNRASELLDRLPVLGQRRLVQRMADAKARRVDRERQRLTREWLQLPRAVRRELTRRAQREHPGVRWNPIVLAPGQNMLRSGRATQDNVQLSLLGFNRAQRRAMKGKKGLNRGHGKRYLHSPSGRTGLPYDRFQLLAELSRRFGTAQENRRIRGSLKGRAVRAGLVALGLAGWAVKSLGSWLRGLFQ